MAGKQSSGWDGYSLGLHLVVCILLATGLGYLLDGYLGTLPLFMLLGVFLGFAAGLWRLFLAINDKKPPTPDNPA